MSAIEKMWTFKGVPGERDYQTLLYKDGKVSCDCPGWTRRLVDGVRTCKHVRSVMMNTADVEAVAMQKSGYTPRVSLEELRRANKIGTVPGRSFNFNGD